MHYWPAQGQAVTNWAQLYDCKAGCCGNKTCTQQKVSVCQTEKKNRYINNLFEGVITSHHFCVHQSSLAVYTTLLGAFIFQPDVARLAVAYNINYSLPIAIICFPPRRQLLCRWPATRPRFKKSLFFSSVASESTSGMCEFDIVSACFEVGG